MAVNALFTTTLILMALLLFLLGECRYLVPYRGLILGPYFQAICVYSTALFLNLFAALYLICRTVFLKDTGKKLAHLEKQLRNGGAISQELAERLDA